MTLSLLRLSALSLPQPYLFSVRLTAQPLCTLSFTTCMCTSQFHSQWVTLTLAAADTLAAAEDEIYERWRAVMPPACSRTCYFGVFQGAPDEIIAYSELARRHFPIIAHGLTQAVWSECWRLGCVKARGKGGSPGAWTTLDQVRSGCEHARRTGYAFFRKVQLAWSPPPGALQNHLRGCQKNVAWAYNS